MYSELPSTTCFRLLKAQAEPEPDEVQGSPGPSDIRISISLQEFDLGDAPGFKALSYTWGPAYHDFLSEEILDPRPVFSHVVLWNGREFPVTQNLYEGLRHLIERGIEDWLWIDAICINQEDVGERGVQVALMGKIYSSAEEVLVWLGAIQKGAVDLLWASTTFIDLLDMSRVPDYLYDDDDTHYTRGDIDDREFHERLGISDPRPRLRDAALFYASCRWFSRAWVAQEVILAQRIRMFSGSVELSFDRLAQMARTFESTDWTGVISAQIELARGRRPQWLTAPWKWHNFQKLKEEDLSHLQLDESTTDNHVPLIWLANATNLVQIGDCADNRDKIYAALGIAEPYFKQRSIYELIRPDYNVSVADLYTRLTMLYLDNWRNSIGLEYLSDAGTRHPTSQVDGLPSWAIDFSQSNLYPARLATFLRTAGVIPERVECDNNHPRMYEVSMSTLTCLGGAIDTVVEVLKIDLTNGNFATSLLKFCTKLPDIIQGVPRFEVLWRTVICDVLQQPIRHPAPAEYKLGFIAVILRVWVRYLQDGKGDAARVIEDGDLVPLGLLKEFQLDDDPEEARRIWYLAKKLLLALMFGKKREKDVVWEGLNKLYDPFTRAIIFSCHNRSLFITDSGLLGLGPGSAQKGDLLCHLCTAHVPYLLRNVPDTQNFSLLGECYVHGIMTLDVLHNCHEEEHRRKMSKMDIV